MKYMEKNEKTIGIVYADFRWVYEGEKGII
jgi:hypothetical protein